MYVPPSFRVDDRGVVAAFIEAFSFATLITSADDGLKITHLPLLLNTQADPWRLYGHMARANDHWRALADYRSTALFSGPHSYISPAWYANDSEVPTWNYVVVEASGLATILESDASATLVDQMVEKYENEIGSPWHRTLPGEYRERQLKHIVAFAMDVEQVQGKFKLGQNRSAADQQRMVAELEQAASSGSRELARFITAWQK